MKAKIKNFFTVENLKKPSSLLIIAAGVFVVVIISVLIYFNNYLHTVSSKSNEQVTFEIGKGESVRKIAAKLEDMNLISNDFPFLVYLKVRGLSGDLKAGSYTISRNNTPLQIIDILTKGKVASLKITIPEGWTNDRIGIYLEEKNIVAKEDFLAATKEKYDFEFLANLPSGASVEGFLFPDTYQLPMNVTAKEIVEKMLQNFDNKLSRELRAEIAASKYNVFETVTLASVVEREVSKPEERKIVAGVFLARLNEGMKLQSDATIQYILNSNKKVFNLEEIKVNSPYNTYQNAGLPAGPIGNPGLESITAVIRPQMTEFRYFLSADGVTYFSKTLDEHEAKKARYLN